MSKDVYTDFEIRAEFWADETANSGIFIRCQDRNKVGSDNAYEVNIFDKRPDRAAVGRRHDPLSQGADPHAVVRKRYRRAPMR